MQLVHDYDSFKLLLNTEPFIYNNHFDYIVFENFVIENMGISDGTVTSFNIYRENEDENESKYFSIHNYRLSQLYLIIENKCLMVITEIQNISDTRMLLEYLVRKRKLERLLS